MIQEELEFRVENCRLTLYPMKALQKRTIPNLRKILKLISQEYWRNEENIHLFFSYIPKVQEELREEWEKASLTFQKKYMDPKYNRGNYIKDPEVRRERAARNKKLVDDVKTAKKQYERFMRKVPKLEKLKKDFVK